MDLFLHPSGYNLWWQYGVLSSITRNPLIWNKIENIYAISGGTCALIYLYRLNHLRNEHKELALNYWGKYLSSSLSIFRTKKIYEGFELINELSYCDNLAFQDSNNKQFFFGTTKVSAGKRKFKWNKVDILNFCDSVEKSVRSSFIPFFITSGLLDFKYLSGEIDGTLSYDENELRDKTYHNHIEIVPYNRKENKYCLRTIKQSRVSYINSFNIFKRVSVSDLELCYAKGVLDGEKFCKDYL